MASKLMVALLTVALGVATWLVFFRPAEATGDPQLHPDAIPNSVPDPQAVERPEAKPAVPEATKPGAKLDPVEAPDPSKGAKGRLRLPDGTSVPVLNGAYNAPAMVWPSNLPYSPIIGRERDSHGLDWYVHADGSKSTTQNIFRKDLGRIDPVTNVFNPAKVLPMKPGLDGETGKPAGGAGK